MPDQHPDLAGLLLRGQRRQLWAMVLLYLIVGTAIGYVWLQERHTHQALCTYRAGLVQSVADSEAFLRTHPGGLAVISAATIRANLLTQKVRIRSLASLHCPDTAP